jgi:predicted Rossmann fold nucleotide-binding protein DprA/Smf involved in DNA uptake
MKAEYKKPIEEGRLLLPSPFKETQRRNTVETATDRNRFVAALADAIFVVHASPNSKMEKFCHEVLELDKPVYTFESEANKSLINIGVKPLLGDLDFLG